jgi:CO/xanthine dehydrogenase FAD-binding subunit
MVMPLVVKTFERAAEAAGALGSDRGARYLGGGTLVMRAVNEGDVSFSTIVRTRDEALTQIRASGSRIEIGAGVTMRQILDSRELAFLHPVARLVGGPAIRNMATVGGNLFAEHPYGDFAVALLTLDATVQAQGGFSPREMALEEMLAQRARGVGLVTSVSFNRPAQPDALRFHKVTRVKPKGVSVLSIAALLPLASGRVAGARVAYGAMAPTPVRAKGVERALEGKSLDGAGIAAALGAALDGTQPVTDALASDWYRREVLPVHLRRLLLNER